MFHLLFITLLSFVKASGSPTSVDQQVHDDNVSLRDILKAINSDAGLKNLPFPPVLMRGILSELLRSQANGVMSAPEGSEFKLKISKSPENEVIGVKLLMEGNKAEIPAVMNQIGDSLQSLSNSKIQTSHFYGPLLQARANNFMVVNQIHPLLQGTLPSKPYNLLIWREIISVYERIARGEQIKKEEVDFLQRMSLDVNYDLLVRLMDPPVDIMAGDFLGNGTYGVVHRAMWPRVGEVALKTVSLAKSNFKSLIEEILAMRAMYGNPHFVNLYWAQLKAYNSVDLTMEFLNGKTGRQILEKKVVFPMNILAAIIKNVLEGLAALHNKGYLHNDIKDDNVFVTVEGKVKILDLGLATRIGRPYKAGMGKAGVPGLAPPEVYDPEVDNTIASDVWTVGTLFLTLHHNTMMELPDRAATLAEDLEGTYTFQLDGALRRIENDSVLDFLRRIFQHNPADRATISDLLSHPFMETAASEAEVKDWIALVK